MSRSFNALALGLMIGHAGVLSIMLAPWVHVKETFGLEWLFHVRGAVNAPGHVVIAELSERPHSCERNPAVAFRVAGRFNRVCGAFGTNSTDACGLPASAAPQ